jgi:hypothetical protein
MKPLRMCINRVVYCVMRGVLLYWAPVGLKSIIALSSNYTNKTQDMIPFNKIIS